MKAFKQYRKLEGIAATRIRLGLSQEAFALELGVSRSLISKAENRERTLPTSAYIKLAGLVITLTAANTAGAKAQPHPVELEESCMNDHAPSVMHYREMNYRVEAESLQNKLTMMRARYQQVRQSLEQVELLIAARADSDDQFSKSCLEMHRYNLCRRLNKCSLPAQASLENKIALKQAAAELSKGVSARFERG
jgi:transcriptional regulator with XRE-family HTH domain